MRLIQWRVHAEGGFELVYAGVSPEDRVWVRDAGGLEVEVAPLVEVAGRDFALNLLGAADGGASPWSAVGEGAVSLSLDPLDAGPGQLWRLTPGRAGGAFAFVDPLGGSAPLPPGGGRLRLELPLGGPSTGAEVELHVHHGTQQGMAIARHLTAATDGDSLATLEFDSPPGAQTISILLRTREVLLAGRPTLHAPAGASVLPRLDLTRRGLARLREADAGSGVARVRAPLPAHLLDGGEHQVVLIVRRPTGERLEQAVSFSYAPRVEVTRKGVERASVVRLVGRLTQPVVRYAALQLFIDGRPGPVEVAKANTAGRFDARLLIPEPFLDGRPHLIEARLADSQALLFATHERVAAFHTRWPVLQLWAQPPLSPESSPAAARHLSALAVWTARVHRGETIPEVLALYDELLAGVRRRTRYPPLAFPEVDAPAVSVVMPAHNKFEITYAGLCALLFAPVDTSFEVVLVDDGSSDETARIEEIVSGLRVVRHAQGEGFVAASNDGAAQARGRYVCFLNNDTEVTAGWLDALVQPFRDDPQMGLTGAKLIYPDGRLQEAGGIVWGTGDPWNAGRGGDPDAPAWNYRRQVDYLSGAAILTSMAIWREVGGFGSEWAPAYFEDTDLAMKIRASGRRVVYAPEAEVYHFEGQTAGVDKTEGVKLHQELNRPKFKEKWRDLYRGHGPIVGERPDLEKDRGATSRALLLVASLLSDPAVAATAEDLQAQGCKVTLWPLDLTWRAAAVTWGRLGVEALFAPFAAELPSQGLARDLDLVVSFVGPAGAPLREAMLEANPQLEWRDQPHPDVAGTLAGE